MDEKTPEAAQAQAKLLEQIAGHLKPYPFLLISLAGLVVFGGVLIFEQEKLEQFKWLLYAVVLIPLALSFILQVLRIYIENLEAFQSLRAKPAQKSSPAVANAGDEAAPVAPQQARTSGLVIASVVALTFVVLGYAGLEEADWLDADTQLGGVFLSGVALVLGVLALRDSGKPGKKGRGIAITVIVVAAFFLLGGMGWLMEAKGVA